MVGINRMKFMEKRKISLFDIDGTIYEHSIVYPLAEYQLRERTIGEGCLNNLYEGLRLYKAGKIDYETMVSDLLDHWAKGLKGASYDIVLEQTKHFLKGEKNGFFPFLRPILALLKETHDIYLVTGEPEFVARTVSESTGFLSSELEIEDGIFTGKVIKYLAKREEKEMAIAQLLKNHDLKDSFAFGDAEGDIGMLSSVEFPICVNPTPGLEEIAKRKDWRIANPEDVEEMVSILVTESGLEYK